MNKKILSTIAVAILALVSLVVFTGAGGSPPQYSVVSQIEADTNPGKLEKVLNQKSKEGWRLHSFNSLDGVAIFVKD